MLLYVSKKLVLSGIFSVSNTWNDLTGGKSMINI